VRHPASPPAIFRSIGTVFLSLSLSSSTIEILHYVLLLGRIACMELMRPVSTDGVAWSCVSVTWPLQKRLSRSTRCSTAVSRGNNRAAVETEFLSPYSPHTHTHGDPHGDLHTHGRPGEQGTLYYMKVHTSSTVEYDGSILCDSGDAICCYNYCSNLLV